MAHEGHDHEGHHHHHHEHAHDQARDHDRDHDRDHADVRSRPRPPLPRGAGQGKLLFLDAPSGLAGDMIVAALVDLGVPEQVIADAVAAVRITGFHLHFGTRVRSAIVATSFEVHVDAKQPSRTYASIRALLDQSTLAPEVRARAHRSLRVLAEAEARVHRTAIDDVHFHEVGAVDSIVDVVATAAALEYLGAELVVSPLPMGRGFAETAHGRLPLPAPATLECLRGLMTYDGGLDFEFVTPTGAAVVAAHASGSATWPTMAPERVGWGAGTATLPDRPNVLRAVLGSRASDAETRLAGTHTVIEANVDDATGELVSECIQVMLQQGALDAWATPITMKKGRPALTLSVLAPRERADALAHALLRETTSLGVRRYDVTRLERPRRLEWVETPFGRIAIKIAGGPFGPAQIKPEFDECVAAARAYGVPVREVLRAAMAAASGIQSDTE